MAAASVADIHSSIDTIRQSQAIAMEKLYAVKLALDERRLQLQQLVSNDTRPRTAFLRTPGHIRLLYDGICRTAVELRAQLQTHLVSFLFYIHSKARCFKLHGQRLVNDI